MLITIKRHFFNFLQKTLYSSNFVNRKAKHLFSYPTAFWYLLQHYYPESINGNVWAYMTVSSVILRMVTIRKIVITEMGPM